MIKGGNMMMINSVPLLNKQESIVHCFNNSLFFYHHHSPALCMGPLFGDDKMGDNKKYVLPNNSIDLKFQNKSPLVRDKIVLVRVSVNENMKPIIYGLFYVSINQERGSEDRLVASFIPLPQRHAAIFLVLPD